jgi:uncharacterized membrane protein
MPKSKSRGKKYQLPNKAMASNQPSKHAQVTSAQQTTQVGTTRQTQFRGEISLSDYPSPEKMALYKEIDPEFPNRLLTMCETEGAHRRAQEDRLLNASIFLDSAGMFIGAVLVIAVLSAGYLFMVNNHSKEGAGIIIAIAVALGIGFLTRGRKKGANAPNR